MRLVVATYNVQSFRAGVERAVQALGPGRPDLVMLQECGPRRRLRTFSEAMQMDAVSSHRPFMGVRNAVLFRAPLRLGGWRFHAFPREGRTLRRGFVVASLRVQGAPLTAISAHLGLVPAEREHHARDLTDHLGGVDGPMILGLDLNEGPEAPAARWIGERLFDAAIEAAEGSRRTFPARGPAVRIDFLFVNQLVSVTQCWVPDSPAAREASDHRPVMAEIEVGKP